jgi:phosphoglycolate phosphatase
MLEEDDVNFGGVIFDVDGVLLDSLPEHLRICEDKNLEFGLGLKIPTTSEFKEMVRRGTRISPMEYFFMAVGFDRESAEKANRQYQEIFIEKYPPKPFVGTQETLSTLHDAGVMLGIVTSNVKANVVKALGDSMRVFRQDCVYSRDAMAGIQKSGAIALAKATFCTDAEVLYVGDQRADWEAAETAGVQFLGAAYGWGISEDDKEFPIVRSVSEICGYVLGT